MQGDPQAISSICYQTVKRKFNMKPHKDKIIIVVLGNNDDQYWDKNENYDPVISYYYLRQLTGMVIGKWRRLH